MAKRNKLGKFADLLSYKHVLENFDHSDQQLHWYDEQHINPKGKWGELIFKNQNPITLELACGKGEYTIGMAKMYPERNFIGVDIKGARIWKGATYVKEQGINNAAFLRTRIEFVTSFFEQNEIEEIWITFADPFLKARKKNRRLTSPAFLDRYETLLSTDGSINLKTDSSILYYYTLATVLADKRIDILYRNNDIYSQPLAFSELDIKTFYELSHLEGGRKIKFLRFKYT